MLHRVFKHDRTQPPNATDAPEQSARAMDRREYVMTEATGPLADKRVIITGAASGIGAGAARLLAAQGARVAALDLNKTLLERTTGEISGDACRSWICDVSDETAVESVFREATDWLGGLTSVVHAAGVLRYKDAQDFSVADWHFVMNVNALGTFLVDRAAFPHLRDDGGSIVNVGSLSGVRGHPGNAVYAASKGAVMSWTRTVAQEWGPFGIRVNALAPVAETAMSEIPKGSPEEQAAILKRVGESIPLRRMGDPDRDIAPAIAFLVSDASHYITGQVLPVDGGSIMVGS
jgi:NAD(P)-dependent dehydrogenase (short-subunit alcohol dehydrogenase family)